MKLYKILSFGFFLLCGQAMAESSLWKSVGPWDVRFYPDDRGCSAVTQYEGGTAFFIGFSEHENGIGFEVIIFNENWKSIEDGKDYDIEVKFGNESPWDLNMTGIEDSDGIPGLKFWNSEDSDNVARFVDEFQRKLSMEWRYQGTSLGRFALRGSRAAFDEVLKCQNSFKNATSDNDPFSTTQPRNKPDPFEN